MGRANAEPIIFMQAFSRHLKCRDEELQRPLVIGLAAPCFALVQNIAQCVDASGAVFLVIIDVWAEPQPT